MKERKKLSKHELCTKRKFILRRKEEFINFRINEKLMLWISGSKKNIFQRSKLVERWSFHSIYTDWVAQKMRRRVLQLYVKKQNNEMIFSLAWKSSLLITKNFLFWVFWRWKIWYFWAKKLMEIWYLLIIEKFLF